MEIVDDLSEPSRLVVRSRGLRVSWTCGNPKLRMVLATRTQHHAIQSEAQHAAAETYWTVYSHHNAASKPDARYQRTGRALRPQHATLSVNERTYIPLNSVCHRHAEIQHSPGR